MLEASLPALTMGAGRHRKELPGAANDDEEQEEEEAAVALVPSLTAPSHNLVGRGV